MERARFDWLVEFGGAAALGLAGGYAAFKAAPSLALPSAVAMAVAGLAFFGLGILAVRVVPPTRPCFALPEFALEPVPDILLLDEGAEEPLLLDQPYREEPLLLDTLFEEEALLLQDPLAAPAAESRVMQLWAGVPPPPTAGELKDRIDRHLAVAPRAAKPPPQQPDASAALFAALDELKRSLR